MLTVLRRQDGWLLHSARVENIILEARRVKLLLPERCITVHGQGNVASRTAMSLRSKIQV